MSVFIGNKIKRLVKKVWKSRVEMNVNKRELEKREKIKKTNKRRKEWEIIKAD